MTVPRTTRPADHLLRILLASFNDQSIPHYVKVDAEAVLVASMTEVQELPHAVAVNKDIDCVKTEAWFHDLNSLEHHLKGVRRDAGGVLVDEVYSGVFRDAYW